MKKYLPGSVSLIMLIAGILLDLQGTSWFQAGAVRFAWYLLAFLPVGFPVIKEAVEYAFQKDFFTEFMLMSIATIGAFYIGEYPEGVAVMLFYSIGELFQDSAVDRARSNIRALIDVRPETASVVRNGMPVAESPEKVEVGETIEIKVGERVPLDGILMNGKTYFDTAALTGESLPRSIRQGENVLAGMIVTDKVARIKVTKPYDQSTLARILEMVQSAAERKAPVELFIRKFAGIYTPSVTALAVLIVLLPYLYSFLQPGFDFVFDEWMYRALVFLVISCPCALVVSIPLGYFGGIGAASKLGILFKGGNYLDAITQVNTVVFDKTGTLTKGVFEVQELQLAGAFSEEEFLSALVSAEANSNHPVAKAIMQYAGKKQIPAIPVSEAMEIAGYGLKAVLKGKEVLVGNARLLTLNKVDFPPGLADIPETVVACAIDGQYAGCLVLSDTPKEGVEEAVAGLKKLNIAHIQILSGDKQLIVSKLAGQLGIEDAKGDLLPEGKVEHIGKLKAGMRNCVAFVGDGINDAPALALSDVGIAMGGLGNDAAIETADVVIQTDQPGKIATAIRVGKYTRKVVWQNISMAFGVKLLVLVLGAGGLATLWEAVFADVGVALLAILNAVRIQKVIKP